MSWLFSKYKHSFLLLPLIANFISFFSYGSVFEGKVGDKEIVMEIEKNDYGLYGTYFYKEDGKNRLLSNDLSQERVLLEDDDESGNLGFYFTQITPPLKGYYFDKNKDLKIPFELNKLDHSPTDTNNNIALQNFSQNDIYEYLRQKNIKIQKSFSEFHQGQEIQWHTEKNSNLSFFTRVPNINQTLQDVIIINNYLEIKFREYMSATLGCTHKKYIIEPSFLSDSVTSFYLSGSYICKNSPTNNFYRELINLDNASGQQLELTDIINIPKNIEQSKWLMNKLTELYPVLMSDPECPFQEQSTWDLDNQMGWLITQDGIELRPKIPEAITICDAVDWAVLPFDFLKKHKSAKNPLQL